MGTGTETKYNPGDTIPSKGHNDLVDGMCGDFVPRDPSTFVPGDLKGKLGNSNFRWNNAYLKKLFLGEIADALSVEDDGAGNFVFKVGGVSVFNSGGFNRAKMSAANYVLGDIQSFTTLSATPATYSTAIITTTGRPVFVGIQGAAGLDSNFVLTGSGSTASMQALFKRNGTLIMEQDLISSDNATFPSSLLWMIDFNASAGANTYIFQAASLANSVAGNNIQLVTFEMV